MLKRDTEAENHPIGMADICLVLKRDTEAENHPIGMADICLVLKRDTEAENHQSVEKQVLQSKIC